MPDFATDPEMLQYQYGTAEKLRMRQEAHELYSEEKTDYFAWILEFLALAPGMVVADVGCGPGAYHPLLAPLGCQAIGIDTRKECWRRCRRRPDSNTSPSGRCAPTPSTCPSPPAAVTG